MEKAKGTRKGYSTGACSAAAARAATLGLVSGQVPDAVDCRLPNGQVVRFEVTEGYCANGHAHAVVIKDAGDDPDVTDKAHLTADVRLLPDNPDSVQFKGGAGVGLVTMRGLGLEVGGPAINPVPRRNIECATARIQRLGLLKLPACRKRFIHNIIPVFFDGRLNARRARDPQCYAVRHLQTGLFARVLH